MGEITRKIKLFNQAYALAWEEVAKLPEGERRSAFLAAAIRSKISAGATDANIIATEAIKILTE